MITDFPRFGFGPLRSLAALLKFMVVCFLCTGGVQAQNEPQPFVPRGTPNRNRPGPWENDVILYRTGVGSKVEKLTTFPHAGVPTLARLRDGRIIAAHQHFPAANDADFDKVAVHFSSDEGRTWTDAEVIRFQGLSEGMRYPFDPTLVPLPDGQVRLYFTSLKGRQPEANPPAIYSAISTNGIDFIVEPGMRFGVEGRPVIDCAAALHKGVFHLFAPDNGAGNNPGARQRDSNDGPRGGVGYHATSNDGLHFTRQEDVRSAGPLRWLGNVQSDGSDLRFFGTGPGGVWAATGVDGVSWTLDDDFPSVPGADPGAVKLKDGGWLLAVTGAPHGDRQQAGAGGGNFEPWAQLPILNVLDANRDGVIDEWELENASALLRKLDRNGDGRLTPDEFGPPAFDGVRPPAPRRARQPVQPQER